MDSTGAVNDVYELICELERRGITKTSEQSKILELESGIKISRHHISEMKYWESMKPYTYSL